MMGMISLLGGLGISIRVITHDRIVYNCTYHHPPATGLYSEVGDFLAGYLCIWDQSGKSVDALPFAFFFFLFFDVFHDNLS